VIRTLRLVTVVVLLTSTVLASPDAPQYSIVELESVPPFDAFSQAYGINDRGQVVGIIRDTFARTRAVLWDHGKLTDLGSLGGDSYALNINNQGQVVGFFETFNCPAHACHHAFLWEKGTMTDLGVLVGFDSAAYGINDAGQIVGFSSSTLDLPSPIVSTPHAAVLWDHGAIVDLGVSPDDSWASAYAINNRGQVVGTTSIFGGSAFLSENGVTSELAGAPASAEDINDRGQVVGYIGDNRGTLPVLWEDGTQTTLAVPPGEWRFAQASGINASGQVSGYLVDRVGVAVLWQNGNLVMLPPLPPRDTFSRPTAALDINNWGEIVGTSEGRAVVWVPREP
jgi:probable HAF family extracellular repeat protein